MDYFNYIVLLARLYAEFDNMHSGHIPVRRLIAMPHPRPQPEIYQLLADGMIA